jgi:thiamine transport system substrate-binding protein
VARTRTAHRALVAAVAATALSACSLVGTSDDSADPDSSGSGGVSTGGSVVLVTHDSFALPKALIQRFEQESGYDLVVRRSGDAGQLTTKLALTADDPTGDVAYGVDNTFAQRALDEGVFAPTDVALPPGADGYTVPGADDLLVPVDHGTVCVNVDTTWFRDHDLAPPTGFADLTDAAYRGLFVTPSALTSSPGLAFLVGTVHAYGDDWPGYWEDLMANDALVVDGWTDAYYGEFTQGGEKGERPIVLSYDSSPAYTVPKGSDASTTSALLDTCVEQVEYAGELAGAQNPDGARALLDFLLSDDVQAALPTSMYVFPVVDGTPLPPTWARYAEQPDAPYRIDPAEVADNRDEWLEQWREIVTR